MFDTWKSCKLGDVIELLSGYSFKSDGYVDSEDAPRLLRGDNIGQGSLRWDNAKRWPVGKTQGLERFWLELGDVVLAMDRPWIEAGMKCAVVTKSDIPCLLVQRVARLRGINGLDTSFLKFVVSTEDFAHYVRSIQTGIAVPHISGKQIEDFALSLPPLPEQRRIATVLNAIQEAIAAQDDLIAAARAFKRSLMARLFTYGPGRAPAVTKETAIGEIPGHWEVSNIGNYCQIKSGTTPSRKNSDYWLEGNIPWVKTGEVNYCTIESTEESITETALKETSLQLYPAGTLLLAMYGQGITRGKVALLGIDATINQACAAIMPTDSSVSAAYLYCYLSSAYERLRSVSHGTQQLNLNASLVEAFQVPIPPVDEQNVIIDAVTSADEKVAAEEDRKSALQSFFQSMLHQLMTGQVRLVGRDGTFPEGAAGGSLD